MRGDKEGALYVAASTVRGAGGGLFAARRLKKGECLGAYTGRKVPSSEAFHPNFQRGYLMAQGSGYVDARDPDGRLVLADGTVLNVHSMNDAAWREMARKGKRGVEWRGEASMVRFANAADAEHARNCVLTRTCGGTGLKTAREVERGEELFISYGAGYWKTFNDDTCAVCICRGFLLECDGCTRSYHPKCARLRGPPPAGDWFCPHCKKEGRGGACRMRSSS